MPAPRELRVAPGGRVLDVVFADGTAASLPAELLRVESPSAEVQGHIPAQKQVVAGKRRVAISGIEPVGHYAVRLIFDDGHDTGIYTWTALETFARDARTLWAAYEAALHRTGRTRG